MAILLDIETVSLPLADLEAVMPDHIRNPQLPEYLKIPDPPDLTKCPKYSGDTVKQEAWIAEAKSKHEIKLAIEEKVFWDKAKEQRVAFIEKAALDPRTATVKLIGLRDTLTGETTIMAHEPRNDFDQALAELGVDVRATEKGILESFFALLISSMEASVADNENILCGYYIKEFDLPFLHKRAWANRIPQRPIYRKGRYWSSEIVDLYEEWGFGERYVASGGLDGLARFLGVPTKTGTGFAFGELYAKDPSEGVAYLVNDLDVLEGCSRAMGVIV